MKNIAISGLMVLALVSCKDVKMDVMDSDSSDTTVSLEVNDSNNTSTKNNLSVALESKSESTAKGVVNFTEKAGKIVFEAKLTGLTPGMHAIHLHEKADCSSADGKSSGGHWNPTFESHGKWGSKDGYHKGDIGNFKVDEDGTGSITLITDEWCMGCDDKNKDILGKAIIVHQGEDDLTSQPSGAAGKRVSCGGIIK